MSIWGRRDSEPPPGETHETGSLAQAQDTQEPGGPPAQGEPGGQAGAEHQAGEPAPAFWRAQGEAPAPYGRAPDDAPPLADALAHEEPAPAMSESAAGTDAPAPVASDDLVVLDGKTAVTDPALTGTAADDAGMGGVEPAPGAQEPAVPETAPGSAVPEPVVPGPAPPEAGMPEAGTPDAAITEDPGPAAAGPPQPAGTPPQAAATPAPASPAGISAQRWSEIMATFVDDPRGSVKLAADAVAEAIDEFVNSVRARQRALEFSWHGTETDTEQLRTALRDYRRFWHQMQQLDPAGKAGG